MTQLLALSKEPFRAPAPDLQRFLQLLHKPAAFSPASTALKVDGHKFLPETSSLQQNTARHRADLSFPGVTEYTHLFVCSGGTPSPPAALPQHTHKGGRRTTAAPKRTEFLRSEIARRKGHGITAAVGGRGGTASGSKNLENKCIC